MAPALTEPGQSQNLKLVPAHTSPGSPTAAVRAVSDEIFFCDITCHMSKSDNIPNGDSTCINGTKVKPSIASLKSSCPRFIIPAETRLVPNLDVGSDCEGENGSFMMNSDPPNQDQSNNMGLQKSNSGITPGLETGGFIKENFLPPEMDQLFKNLGAAINSSDIGQNMDELLQVFKSMESSVGDAALEEALAVTNDPVEAGEPDTIFPIPDGTDLTSGLSTFERDFLNEVELNMCVDGNLSDNNLNVSKIANSTERIEEARRKQFESERRCEWLMRRLRKLQSKAMGRHISEEVNGLMLHTQNLLNQTQSQIQEIGKERRLTKSLSQMLKQFQDNGHGVTHARHSSVKYFGSGSSERTVTVPVNGGFNLGDDTKSEVGKVAGQLHTQLHMVENSMDSDVTASSSGGESCDEMVSYNNQHQQTLSIMKRAAWRWAQERAGVASRWTWLQAQISDLEYRIRQHTDVHRQIRLTKGEVKLGGASPPTTNDQVVNGFHTSSTSTGSNSGDVLLKEPPECMGATGTCRTRPFIRTNYRKRKLLNIAGLHLVSKKAARSSTVRCGCRPPLASCALCTGRSDPTHPRELPDLLTVSERIALLDPAYHPVLSFPSDVSQSLHLEALIRTPEWQQKMQRSALKSSHKILGEERRAKKHVEHRKKYQRLKKGPNSLANIQKIKKKLTRGRKPKNHDSDNILRHKRKTKLKHSSAHPSHSSYDDSGQDELRVDVAGSCQASPVPSPGDDRAHNYATERNEALRRKRENSYDIDNIVIPYSIASSTRVEKLQYKEILTPKWRVVDSERTLDFKNNGIIRRSSHESDVEDVSDEMVMQRHERCEQEERKKFMAYVKNPSAGRPRIHRRTDSRAGSSGANTPDPLSPNNAAENAGEGVSPITSPPATPGAATAEHDPMAYYGVPAPVASALARRRTVSQSKLIFRDEYGRSATPELNDEVSPYEPRVFPLSDETYEKMLRSMPEGYPGPPYMTSNPPSVCDTNDLTEREMNDNQENLGESLPATPSTDTDSAAGEEDPNDPEWTIDETESNVKR